MAVLGHKLDFMISELFSNLKVSVKFLGEKSLVSAGVNGNLIIKQHIIYSSILRNRLIEIIMPRAEKQRRLANVILFTVCITQRSFRELCQEDGKYHNFLF